MHEFICSMEMNTLKYGLRGRKYLFIHQGWVEDLQMTYKFVNVN